MGTRVDPERAQNLAERACDLGSSEGCIYAAYDQARVTQNEGRLYTALSRLNHHCALGRWLACAFVGELHEDGYQLARSP
jgi:TPR repeat protein